MAEYIRQDTLDNIADNKVINASDFDAEFDAIADAFDAINDVPYYYDTRAEATAVNTNGKKFIEVNGLKYILDDGNVNAALTSNDGYDYIPFGRTYADHFGENTTPGTTDMTSAIQAAIDFAYSDKGSDSGGRVYIKGLNLVSDVIELKTGVHLIGDNPPTSHLLAGGPTGEGSTIIGSHLTGPVIWQYGYATLIKDLTIDATGAREAASISSGVDLPNCGILTATVDSADEIVVRANLKNVMIFRQPADGHHVAGYVSGSEWENVTVDDCHRHGFVCESGYLWDRTNKKRPGINTYKGSRAYNVGGHLIMVGHPSESLCPFRIYIETFEGFRGGNDPTSLQKNAAAYLRGEQITVVNSAFGATSGYTGDTPTLDYSVAVSGRQNKFLNNRYIRCTDEFVLIFVETGLDNTGITFEGMHCATETPYPANAFKITAQVEDFNIGGGITGNFTGDVVSETDWNSNSCSGIINFESVTRFIGSTVEIDNLNTTDEDPLILGSGFRNAAITIDDDDVQTISIIPSGKTAIYGLMAVSGNTNAAVPCLVAFRVGSSNYINILSGSATGSTSVLTGTTGVDGDMTISSNGDLIYFENRTGDQRTIGYTLISAVSVV